ncbi:oligosaccharide flippase family protein [Nocardia sp. 348MFTsu5.1]|uniref:oligosaccharide flippase family protein n=1 Tax=Nocardia sp. 348MFTsu5.1 TaxID=1172185 RepID=UPI0003A2F81F|nr:oligosaccharide flippase family protein [Nocardia sp. 348MFTsu5.1]
MTLRDSQVADHGELGQRTSRALIWSFANTALARLGTVGIGIALARLLGPEEFGTFAIATVALLAVLSFNEFGVSLAIVRWSGDPQLLAPTVATLSTVTSCLLYVGTFFAAPVFAGAMGDPDSTGVIRLMCLCIVVNGIVAAPAALMQRAFAQRERFVIDQVNIWVGAVVSIGLAIIGCGAMSLAIGRVTGTVLSGLMFIRWAPGGLRFGWDAHLLPSLLRFGLPLAGASAIVFAAGNADQLVVGTMLGPTELGFYVLAFNLASWPVALFSAPLRSVAPATLSRLQHIPEAMNDAFTDLTRVLAALSIPVCFLLAGAAEPIVALAYGSEWAPAADALRWLALLAALRIMFELAYDYLVVVRRTGSILVIQSSWLVVSVPALLIGATQWGIGGVAGTQVVVAAVVALPLYVGVLGRSGVDIKMVGRAMLLPVLIGVAVGTVSLWVSSGVQMAFVACLVAGALACLGVALASYRQRDVVARLRNLRADEVGAS